MSDLKTKANSSATQTATHTAGAEKDEAEMLANLDLIMNLDVVENEKDWSLFSNGSESADSMPNDLPGDAGDDQ